MAILLTPGQSVGQGDWEAVFAQHGGFKSVQTRLPTQQEIQAAAQGGDPDPAYQQAPIYRYYLNDGSYVEARTAQNGADYAVIAYQPSAKFAQDQAKQDKQDTPQGQNEAELQRQRTANAALPPGQDPAYETDEDRRKRAQDTITRQGKEAADAEARRVAGLTQTKKTPLQDHPGVSLVLTYNPQTQQTESHYERDDTPGVPIAAPPDIKPGTRIPGGGLNGEDVQAIADPATGVIKYVPIEGAQVPAANRPIPSGAPVYRPDYNQDDLGLGSYNEQLLAAQRAGIITAEQGRQLVTQASALAQTTTSHGTTIRSQESTTRGQDISQRGQDLNETESRRSFQGTGFDNTLREIGSNAKYLGAGHGGLAADAFLAALNIRQRYAAGAGGFQDHPQVAAAREGTQVHIGPDGNVAISPPGSVPGGMADAAGIRTGSAMTGTGVDAPVSRGPVQPAFRPPPPVSGATVPTPSAYPPADEFGRTPAPTAGEPGGPPLQTTYPPYSPPLAQPLEGSGFWRGPADGGASSDPGFTRDLPAQNTGVPPPVPMPDFPGHQGQLPSYLQPVATPQWQPHGVSAQLRSQGYSDEEIQQAMAMAGVA